MGERDYQSPHPATEIQSLPRLKPRIEVAANRVENEIDIFFSGFKEFLEQVIIEVLATKFFISQYRKIRILDTQLNPVFIRFITQNICLRWGARARFSPW